MSEMITKRAAEIAADWWTEKISKNLHEDTRIRFRTKLRDTILDRREAGHLSLDCDYAPNRMLADCAREAGVKLNNFPWKTNMEISGNTVMVSDGYGQPFERIG